MKEEQKKHIVEMMKADEELGLYDIFNEEKRQGVKDLIDTHKQDDENYLDSFGVTKTQFEVYRNFNKQETLEESAERLYPIILEDDGWDKNKQYRDEWIEGAKWRHEIMYSEEEVIKLLISCKDRFGGSGLEDYTSDSEIIEWFEQFKNK